MRVLKYVIMALTLLNIPSIIFFEVSPAISSVLSYGTYALLIVFFILEKGSKPNMWLLILGLTFFTIAGINFYAGEESEYFITFVKYIITIVCGSALVKKITPNEIFIFLFIGALSIFINAAIFPSKFGRYSGLYVNANLAGFIAVIAYSLTFRIKRFSIRTILQVLITLAGIFTFSRTFILIWVLLNLISLKINIKNIRILAIGVGLLLLLSFFGSVFKLNTTRLKQFTAVINSEEGAITQANEASRTETWALYYDAILENPFFGNGYNSFQKIGLHSVSIHNNYLLFLGEAGLVPFLIFLGLSIYLLYMGYKLFDLAPYLLLQAIAFFLFMLTFHNFLTTDAVLVLTLWMFYQIKTLRKQKQDALLEDDPQSDLDPYPQIP